MTHFQVLHIQPIQSMLRPRQALKGLVLGLGLPCPCWAQASQTPQEGWKEHPRGHPALFPGNLVLACVPELAHWLGPPDSRVAVLPVPGSWLLWETHRLQG